MAPEQRMKCLVQPADGKGPPVVSWAHAVPSIEDPHHVLVKVSAVALNPTDYKMPEHHPVPGAILGCDFMGTIVAAGPKAGDQYPVGTRVCGPMHGSNPGNPGSGTFAEYLVQDSGLLVRVPDSWSDAEGAALGGVGWATVALCMEDSLKLTGTPSRPAAPRADGSRIPVLVYGGATATGTMACQLLSSSGYDPIATCSPASSGLVRKYGAVSTTPYSSPNCADTIRDMTKGSLKAAIDCITSPESMRCCFASLGRAGARYACLEFAPDEWRTRKAVQVDMPMTYSVMGREVKLSPPYYRPEDRSKLELGARWCREVQKLVDEGSLRCHPVQEVPGGWEGIIKGLEMLQQGQIRGKKVVVRVDGS
ncbi:alcohol dehydrogenase GroES-like domain-containing protein [Hypoxylon rubiginosum]|uniref:Alcohol dehydrogenase GroES-like domain-containing protein n=1 Tax=Hypoxylon rubiginosum TaxID=110542 RepID=A0ACC0DMN3_9PEZI|nr:alcohol dehydrogenase GroES-like domain-containing protein [Hypoxylon rubiginosum]